MPATLRLLSGTRKGTLVEISGSPFRVGRDPACDLCLGEGNASRLHAQFLEEGGRLVVENLKSTNGIYVNGGRQERAVLRVWDVIVIGGTAMRLESLGGETAAPPRSSASSTLVAVAPRAREGAADAASGDASGSAPGDASGAAPVLPGLVRGDAYHTLLKCLLGIQKLLGEDDERMIERSLDMLFLALPVTRLSLFSVLEDGSLVQGHTSTRSGAATGHMSHGFARRVLEANRAILLESVPSVGPADWGNTLHEQEVCSILGVPVLVRGQPVAVLLCDNLESPGILDQTHVQVLQFMSRALEYVFQRDQLRTLEQRQVRADHEYLAARRVQAQIFNKDPADLHGPVRWAVHCQPALELGGDFYDFHESPRGTTWIIADVSGKGVPAALVVSMIKAFCKTLHPRDLGPRDFLTALDGLIRGELPETMFFTGMVAHAAPDGVLTWCNVGHPPGYVVRRADRSLVELSPAAGMLGMSLGDFFSQGLVDGRMVLAKGDRLCLYTDGVIEAGDGHGGEFGAEQLMRQLAAGLDLSLERALSDLVGRLSSHDPRAPHLDDDVTVVLGEW